MSSSGGSPVSWRGHEHGNRLNHSAYDPAFSFAYTSAYSGTRVTSTRVASPVNGGERLDGVLNRDQVHNGLTDLGRTGEGTKLSYLTLSLSDRALSDVSLLTLYPHLQRLNLASNNLTDLSVLGYLPHLVYLDVSYNRLTSVLDFQPPPKNLLDANYSNNDIEVVGDLSKHLSLSKLILDRNQVAEISGLSELSCLRHLSLADNRIERIIGLKNLGIKFLRLSGNSIKRIQNLETLDCLQVLDLSGNHICSLNGLQGHRNLTDINMEENQVVDMKEVVHLKDLNALTTLNLSNNPVESLLDYRPTVVFHLNGLVTLDGRKVEHKEKVAATNRFCPPAEVVAAHDHRTNITASARKQAMLRFSTLTEVEEPYPMLVLCGPPSSGKAHFCKLLIKEFPRFFGLGVSHTTRGQRSQESHGVDYYYIDSATFHKAISSGEFVETCRVDGAYYGLTMAAIEQVAQKGLACVTHMGLQGVLSMKNTHFEPRYILTLTLNPQIHEQRLKAKGCYSDAQIRKALADVDEYAEFHRENPGFFDTAINTDSLKGGYFNLRALIMAYGDITPEMPLSPMFPSQFGIPVTATASTEHLSPHTPLTPDTPHTPSPLNPHDVDKVPTESSKLVLHAATHSKPLEEHIKSVAMNVSLHTHSSSLGSYRGPSSILGADIHPISGVKKYSLDTDHLRRQERLIKAALAGKATPVSSRPGTSMSKSDRPHSPHSRTISENVAIYSQEEGENQEDSSSRDEEYLLSKSSLYRLSSELSFGSSYEPATPGCSTP